MVDAPSSLFDEAIFEILFITALNTPLASTPGCEKKFLSSADKNELITLLVLHCKEQIFFFQLKNHLLTLHHLNKLYLKLMVYNS